MINKQFKYIIFYLFYELVNKCILNNQIVQPILLNKFNKFEDKGWASTYLWVELSRDWAYEQTSHL